MSRTTSNIVKVRNPSGGHVLVWDTDKREWVNMAVADLLAALGSSVGSTNAGAQASATISSTTNDFAPGSAVGRVMLSLGSADRDITGMVAGADGEKRTLFNVDSVGTAYLRVANVGSAAANRFVGQSDAAVPPSGKLDVVYNTSPVAGWYLG